MPHSPLHQRLPKALLLITLGLCASAATAAEDDGRLCNKATFYADLRTTLVVNGDPALFNVLSPMTPSGIADCAGWHELMLQVNIPKECTAATVTVGYEKDPRLWTAPFNWTLNIGDSPTNNGWAGDAGTTVHNAELWILNDSLSLANAGGSPGVIDNPLVYNGLAMTDGGMQFLIKDQFVSWGHPYQITQSPTNKLLFAIPDTTMPDDERSIYVGLNRVIDGPSGRTGCGLRTAVIAFQ
jgi:hypothetical protein